MTTRCVVTDEQLGVYARCEHELFDRARRGTIPIDRVLQSLQDMLEGNFDAIPVGSRRLVDCDATPFIPDGCQIKPEDQLPNVVRGQIEFDAPKVGFHLDDGQKAGSFVVGTPLKLKLKLADKMFYGAQVLDHLLANTNLIPDSWKTDEQGCTRYIFFWGTIYRDSDGNLYVRYLYWGGGRWYWNHRWLSCDFGGRNPAAVPAS